MMAYPGSKGAPLCSMWETENVNAPFVSPYLAFVFPNAGGICSIDVI